MLLHTRSLYSFPVCYFYVEISFNFCLMSWTCTPCPPCLKFLATLLAEWQKIAKFIYPTCGGDPVGCLVLHSNIVLKRDEQELSYREQMARLLRTQYVEGIYDNPVTLKYRLTVTQGHWKRNHRVNHTRLTISRVIGRWILSWPWSVGQRPLKVIEISAIRKLWCDFLFAFYSNYGRICSRLWDIQCQRMAWPWKPG